MEKPPPALGITTQTQEKYKCDPAPDFHNPVIQVESNITTSAIAPQRYLTTILIIFPVQTLLVTKPTLSTMHPILLQVNPTITTPRWQKKTTPRTSKYIIFLTVINSNITIILICTYQETASIEKLNLVISETSLWAPVMVQPIIQAAISLMETFNGTESKSECWITSGCKMQHNYTKLFQKW